MSCCFIVGHVRIAGLQNDQCGTLEDAVLASWEGRVLNKVLYGKAPSGAQTLTLKYTNFYQNGAPFIYLEQNCTTFQTNGISYDRHIFPGLSVLLAQFSRVSRC